MAVTRAAPVPYEAYGGLVSWPALLRNGMYCGVAVCISLGVIVIVAS